MSESTYFTSSSPSLCSIYPVKLFINPRFLSSPSSPSCPSSPRSPRSPSLCSICFSPNRLFLLKCITCSLEVHSSCYQIETFQDPWQCQKCLLEQYSTEKAECLACKQTTGAMRLYPQGWMHVLCLSWPTYENYSDSKCSFCLKSDGLFLNCGKCLKIFHPYCGVVAGLRNFEGLVACQEHFQHPTKRRRKQLKQEEKENLQPVPAQKDLKKRRKRRKQPRGRKKTVKITGNLSETLLGCSDIPINWEGSPEELQERFEDFLFKTCEVCDTGYLLPSSLQSLLSRQEIRFKDIPSVLSLFN